jgi:hypothetical protein
LPALLLCRDTKGIGGKDIAPFEHLGVAACCIHQDARAVVHTVLNEQRLTNAKIN